MTTRLERLYEFVAESNRIEGLEGVCEDEVGAHEALLAAPRLLVPLIEEFVYEVTAGMARLRNNLGMDVRVGAHFPPPGGPDVEDSLALLLGRINKAQIDPHTAHVAYETLHPFMDGNGRSGRAIWAWQMLQRRQDPFALGFLHRFYYQTLDAERA